MKEKGVTVKVNDPYYTPEEIRNLADAETFPFPEGLSEFECILIVAGHRLYKAVTESQLRKHLSNCRLVIDNMEEAWAGFDWDSMRVEYAIAGGKGWLG